MSCFWTALLKVTQECDEPEPVEFAFSSDIYHGGGGGVWLTAEEWIGEEPNLIADALIDATEHSDPLMRVTAVYDFSTGDLITTLASPLEGMHDSGYGAIHIGSSGATWDASGLSHNTWYQVDATFYTWDGGSGTEEIGSARGTLKFYPGH